MAWRGSRQAIETIYGTLESIFVEFPNTFQLCKLQTPIQLCSGSITQMSRHIWQCSSMFFGLLDRLLMHFIYVDLLFLTKVFFRVVTVLQINDRGGNTHIVQYFQHTCTYGKQQMKRFSCSHAIAVC